MHIQYQARRWMVVVGKGSIESRAYRWVMIPMLRRKHWQFSAANVRSVARLKIESMRAIMFCLLPENAGSGFAKYPSGYRECRI
jgi:hypothetical protein